MNNSLHANRWLLPEGIEEILPPDAWALDRLCRQVIDLFTLWGYQLVTPPLIEYLESLLTGTGEDLELQTFKVTDLMSGRMMGIRADTTPQVARIDAHNLKRETPTRLCYAGTVLHTRPASSGGTRSPLQAGAELYGHAGIESDAEVLCLMLQTLESVGVQDLHIDLGHVGVFRGLVKAAGIDETRQSDLFDILQRKARSELQCLLQELSLPDAVMQAFLALIDLNGGDEVLEQAASLPGMAGSEALDSVRQLADLAQRVRQHMPDAPLYFDLAELRGYHYHTGIMFAAYVPDNGDGIAYGGRYDNIGSFFGRARPATGFSMDLKTLMTIMANIPRPGSAIFAPAVDAPGLDDRIAELRAQGEIVIMQLPGQIGGPREMQCDRELVRDGKNWSVRPID